MKHTIRIFTFFQVILFAGMIFAQTDQNSVAAGNPDANAAVAPAATAPATTAPETVSPADPAMAEFQKKLAVYQEVMTQIDALQKQFDEARKAEDSAKTKEIQEVLAPPLIQKAKSSFYEIYPIAKIAYKNSDGKNKELNEYLLNYTYMILLPRDNYDEAYQMFVQFLDRGLHKEHPEILEAAGISAFGSNRFKAAKTCFGFAKKAEVKLSQQAQTYSEQIENYYEKEWMLELQKEQAEAKAADLPQVLVRTSAGDMVFELFENEAPNTVASFITLVEKGFYNGLTFHRVLPGFMAQGGCPKGDGTGDAGYKLPEEYTKEGARKHFRGSLAMARSQDPNSAGSQFYICFLPTQFLDGNYTVFGRVVDGIGTLAKIERIDPDRSSPDQPRTKIIEMKVLRKRPHDYSHFQTSK